MVLCGSTPRFPLINNKMFYIMNEVTVSVLPHPISMFFIGALLLGMFAVLIEFSRTKREYREFKREVEETLKSTRTVREDVEKSIEQISRKVDSRIDKALGNLKKD